MKKKKIKTPPRVKKRRISLHTEDGKEIRLKRVRWRGEKKERIPRRWWQITILALISVLIGGYFGYFCRWSFLRLFDSVIDLGVSIAEYLLTIFLIDTSFLPGTIDRVPDVPFVPFLPLDSGSLSGVFERFFALLFNAEHFAAYNAGFADFLLAFQRLLLPIVLMIFVIRVKLEDAANEENDRFDYVTPGARRWEKIFAFFARIRDFILSIVYACPVWLFWTMTVVILAGTNLLTVVIGFLANVLHLSVSLSLGSSWIQLYKLALDLTITFSTLPWYVWALVFYVIFCKLRRMFALNRLAVMEGKIREFIKRLPLAVLITGKIGVGKTQNNMNLTLSMQDAMRESMQESMLTIRAEFPGYPWENLDRQIGIMYLCGDLPSKAATRTLFSSLAKEEEVYFGYTGERTFSDGVTVKYLSDRLVDYAELQYMYRVQCLVSSNYSLRVDADFTDKGKFPLWTVDYFGAPPFDPHGAAVRSHILDFDTLRLGRTFDAGNAGAWEFGILSHTEMGKDFGNALTNKDLKTTDKSANIKNDMLIDRIKILRHSSTACYTPYCRYFGDEQRPTSLGADALDLCDVLKISDSSETKSTYPLLTLERFFYDLLESLWFGWYATRSVNRADTDAFVFLLRWFMRRFYPKIEEQRQLFGYQKMKVRLVDGADLDAEPEVFEIYNCFKKTRAGRYATDCFSDIVATRALRSDWEFDLSQSYEGNEATPEELARQHSYFGKKLLNIRGDDNDPTGSD